jgi:hypothetical protein
MPRYYCECCKYETERKDVYDKHNKTNKHKKNLENKPEPKPEPEPEPKPEPEPIKPLNDNLQEIKNELIKHIFLVSLYIKIINLKTI